MEGSINTANYLRFVEGLNIKIYDLDAKDQLLWYEVEQILKDNGLWNDYDFDDEGRYFRHAKRIYAVTTKMFDFEHIKKTTKKDLWTPEIKSVIYSPEESLYRYMYEPEYCDNYYGHKRYCIQLPFLNDSYNYIIILLENDNVILGRYGVTEFGYELDKCYYDNDIKQVPFDKLDEPYKSLIIEKLLEEKKQGHNMEIFHFINDLILSNKISYSSLTIEEKNYISSLEYEDRKKAYIELQNKNAEEEIDIDPQESIVAKQENIEDKIYKYNIYSSFLMVCDCKSFRNSLTINSYISIQLKINKYDIKYLYNSKEKPIEYDILLYDLYNDEYWILDKKTFQTNEESRLKNIAIVNYEDIEKYVIQYVEDNNKIFKLCFIEMKHYLLNKLNNTNIMLFKKIFIDYYCEYTQNKIITPKYYNKFIEILEKICEITNIGNYILHNYEDFFDKMLNDFCITHYDKKIITDANYIITSINNLLK